MNLPSQPVRVTAIAFLFSALTAIASLLVGCAVNQPRVRTMSESSADAMMKHLRAITKGPIPLGKILKDVDPSAVYTISSRHRELDIMGAINFAKAPGISNEDLLAKNVTELAIPFGMAVTTFVTEVSCFIVFVRRDRVIAIGFSGSQTIPSFREWVAK